MLEPPQHFKRQLRDAFATLEVGQTFTYTRTFTEADASLFCGLTGDFNPFHLDASFSKASWYGGRILPGLLTGSMITHIGGLLGFLATEMSFRFQGPVYVGDTVTCVVTIAEKDPEARRIYADAVLHNQDGAQVMSCRFAGFPSQVRLTPDPR
ncbi:MAG TPA: MaoC family dehydratase [Oscillatoriaceae cyanobacterium]